MNEFRLQDPGHEAVRRMLLQKYGTSRFHCAQFVREMQARFPDLRRVAGFYFAPDSDASHGEHWWLEAADGTVIDPTADQFPSQGAGRYVRYNPQRHCVVKGKCMNCGIGLYSREGSYPCSRACARDLAAEYGLREATGPFEDEMEFECDSDISEKYGLAFRSPF